MEWGFSINEKMLETNLKEEPIMAQRIVYEIVSKEDGILRADIMKKSSDLKQSWVIAKAAEPESKECQNARK